MSVRTAVTCTIVITLTIGVATWLVLSALSGIDSRLGYIESYLERALRR